MRRLVSWVLLPWIVSVVGCFLASAVAPGFCAAAFADAWSGPPASGAISGGFFGSDAMAPAPAARVSLMPMPDLCGPAIARASAARNLPPGLLNAIARVESGRVNPQTGAIKPWPWTIDANGAGFMYPTESQAAAAAAGFQAAGVTSLDIGCLQVNLAQHPDAFQTLAQAFDPAANADYAAAFLSSLGQKFGNWPQAVAAYHSQTPALGAPYQARVYAQWLGGGNAVAAAEPLAPPPAFELPALPQTAFEMSSLIPPAARLMQPRGAITGHGLAWYRAAPVAIATLTAPQG